jgi:hypothetical protein
VTFVMQRANLATCESLPLRDALIQSVRLTLTPEQQRFLWLHARTNDAPTKWRWHFSDTMLRAYTDTGHTATISAGGFAHLVDAGLMERVGLAMAKLTQAGRDAAK